MIKELGLKDMAIATVMMLLISTAAGSTLNLLLDRVLPAPYLALFLAGLAITLIAFCGGSSDRRESRKIFTKSTKERRI